MMDVECTAVVDSACSGHVLDAGSAREDRSSDVCFVRDTRWSFSEKDYDSILHTHHLCRTTREALWLLDIVSHRNNFSKKKKTIVKTQSRGCGCGSENWRTSSTNDMYVPIFFLFTVMFVQQNENKTRTMLSIYHILICFAFLQIVYT